MSLAQPRAQSRHSTNFVSASFGDTLRDMWAPTWDCDKVSGRTAAWSWRRRGLLTLKLNWREAGRGAVLLGQSLGQESPAWCTTTGQGGGADAGRRPAKGRVWRGMRGGERGGGGSGS